MVAPLAWCQSSSHTVSGVPFATGVWYVPVLDPGGEDVARPRGSGEGRVVEDVVPEFLYGHKKTFLCLPGRSRPTEKPTDTNLEVSDEGRWGRVDELDFLPSHRSRPSAVPRRRPRVHSRN